MLLDHAGQVDARNEWGGTPLYLAATGHYPDVAALLLRRGADANGEDESGRTVLNHLFGDEEMEALLRGYGARE